MSKSSRTLFCAAIALAAVTPHAHAEGETKTIRINKVAYDNVTPSVALDAQMRLKKIFLFPSLDDVSGVLSPVLDGDLSAAISEYTRFSLVKDSEIIKALNSNEQSYAKVAEADSVHREAIKAAGADASIFLRSRTRGGSLELTLELRDQSGAILLSETKKIPGFSSRDARSKQIADLFGALVEKIPFVGTVTGRSGKTLTIDLGRGQIKVGDEIEVIRLMSIQRHPLLKTMVGADFTKVGRAKVSSVDKIIAFADVMEEQPGEVIAPDNKIVTIRQGSGQISRSEPVEREEEKYTIKQQGKDVTPHLEGDLDRHMPEFGYATADLGYGTISHQHSTSGASSVEASGAGLGASLSGELWVTKNWIVGGGFQLHGATLESSTASIGSTSWNKFEAYGGYRLIPGKLDELSILFAAGVSASKIGLPSNTTSGTGPRSYTGILFKAAGDIMIMPKNKAWIGVEIVPFGTFEETGTGLGAASTVNTVGLNIDWLRELYPNLWGRVGIKVELANASITGGGTNSDKRFIFGPGVLYYF